MWFLKMSLFIGSIYLLRSVDKISENTSYPYLVSGFLVLIAIVMLTFWKEIK